MAGLIFLMAILASVLLSLEFIHRYCGRFGSFVVAIVCTAVIVVLTLSGM